jgi:hypothetical protein
MIEYERHRTDDPDLTKVQDKIEVFTEGLQSGGILSGRLLPGVQFASSVTKNVPHGLGRKYQGYIVVSVNAKAVIQVVDGSNYRPAEYIAMQSNGVACTASLWVF